MSQKGRMKVSLTPSNQTTEKIMCSEILSLAKSFTEVPNVKFTNSTYCDVLSKLITFLNINYTVGKPHTDKCGIYSLIAPIFASKDNKNNNKYLNFSSLDNNIMNTIDGNGYILSEEDNLGEENGVIVDSISDGSDIEVEVVIGVKKVFNTTVKKSSVQKPVSRNRLKEGIDKMKKRVLLAVRYRKRQILEREQVAVCDSIYQNLVNTNISIHQLQDMSYSNLFCT